MNSPATFTDITVAFFTLLLAIFVGHCEINNSLDGIQSSLESRCIPVEQAGQLNSEQAHDKGILTERGWSNEQ